MKHSLAPKLLAVWWPSARQWELVHSMQAHKKQLGDLDIQSFLDGLAGLIVIELINQSGGTPRSSLEPKEQTQPTNARHAKHHDLRSVLLLPPAADVDH